MKANLSICLIVKNEPLLEKCILSFRDYVEELVIIDTGSTDNTPEIAKKYADIFEVYTACNDPATGLINNFSEARQRGFDLSTKPWVGWCDADDELIGAEKLPQLISSLDNNVDTFVMFPYEYAYDEKNRSICTHYRERIISSKNKFHWQNPVHEVLVPDPGVSPLCIKADEVVYKHNRQYGTKVAESGRNLRILRDYFKKHGDSDTRQLYYLGLECYNMGLTEEAIVNLAKYIDLSGWDDERAMACLKLIDIALGTNNYVDGLKWAFKLVEIKENWSEGYFALGKIYYFLAQKENSYRHWERCANYIKIGFSFPKTDTLLFINPTERDIEINRYYNIALNHIGKVDEALAVVNNALQFEPEDGTLLNNKVVYETYLAKNQFNVAANNLINKNLLHKPAYDLIIQLLNDPHAAENINKRLSEPLVTKVDSVKTDSISEWNIPLDFDLTSNPLDLSDEKLSSTIIMLWKQFMLRNKAESAISFLENSSEIVKNFNIDKALEATYNHVGISKKQKLNVIFYAGDGMESWNPESVKKTGIGGSELMMIHQAKNLAALGHKVRVYCSCGEEGVYDGVEYYFTNKYINLTCDVLVVSRNAAALGDNFNISAKLKLLWVHDVCAVNATNALLLKADRILALTNWHKQNIVNTHLIHPDHVLVTRNGIDINRFNKTVKRNKFKVVNSSSPDRSLPILLTCWYEIRKQVPEAELHIYYGFKNWEASAPMYPGQMDLINSLKQQMKDMAGLGVKFHDRINQDQLAEELLGAGVWAFPSWYSETSCISAMEMQAAGLKMVTSSIAALNETVGNRGTLIDGDWTSIEYKTKFVNSVVHELKNATEEERVSLQNYAKENFGLESLAKEWEDMFYSLLEDVKVNIVPYQPTIPYRVGGRGYYDGDTRNNNERIDL